MLVVAETLSQLDLESVYAVYGRKHDLYDYYMDLLCEKDALCALWVTEGVSCSALRIQRYQDGVLLSGLETAPEQRGKGYASSLVQSVVDLLRQRGCCKIYSHVARNNAPSYKLHIKCGFHKLRDTACLLDGTVTTRMDTLCLDI